jgi:Flp pilus assembly secretin CpaC
MSPILLGLLLLAPYPTEAIPVVSAAPFRPEAARQIQLDVVLFEVPGDDWVSLDGCPARYADRFGRNRAAHVLGSAARLTGCPVDAVVPGWVVRSAKALWFRGGTRKASQDHLDGILDPMQDTAFVAFLEENRRAKVISQPRIVTMSGRQASLLCGGEQAVPMPSGRGSIGVCFEEFGTRTNFVPTAVGNGRIKLECEVSEATPDTGLAIAGAPVAGYAHVTQRKRTVELEPGQSLVLGGRGWVVLVKPALVTPEEDLDYQIILEPPGLDRSVSPLWVDEELRQRIQEETLRRTKRESQ